MCFRHVTRFGAVATPLRAFMSRFLENRLSAHQYSKITSFSEVICVHQMKDLMFLQHFSLSVRQFVRLYATNAFFTVSARRLDRTGAHSPSR